MEREDFFKRLEQKNAVRSAPKILEHSLSSQ